MPARNTSRFNVDKGTYHHVYSRGVGKQVVFHDDQDKRYFLKLLMRYLDPSVRLKNANSVEYKKFNDFLELNAFCIMDNHFHLLIYVKRDPAYFSQFLRQLICSYSMFYNRRYDRSGVLFESRFRSSHVDKESYLLHITRYIHVNPASYSIYRYSSYRFYVGRKPPGWLVPLDVSKEVGDYKRFVSEYVRIKEGYVESESIVVNPP